MEQKIISDAYLKQIEILKSKISNGMFLELLNNFVEDLEDAAFNDKLAKDLLEDSEYGEFVNWEDYKKSLENSEK